MGSRPRNSSRARKRTPRRKPETSTTDIQDRLSSIAASANVLSNALSFSEEDDAALAALDNIVMPLRQLVAELEGRATP